MSIQNKPGKLETAEISLPIERCGFQTITVFAILTVSFTRISYSSSGRPFWTYSYIGFGAVVFPLSCSFSSCCYSARLYHSAYRKVLSESLEYSEFRFCAWIPAILNSYKQMIILLSVLFLIRTVHTPCSIFESSVFSRAKVRTS